MKRLIILFLLLIPVIANCQFLPTGYSLQRSQSDGKYYSIYNSDSSTGGVINFDLTTIDTNYTLVKNKSDGKYNTITNKHSLFGAVPGSISANLVYLLNNNLTFTDKPNNFTATQYFQRIVADTLTVNHIDSVHSTYWYSNTGDTIGYIDAATEKVAFFKQMKVGTLATNTTVAENFIRSNQVQTDTIYPHSPLILAGDTTIAKGFFANYLKANDSIIVGNIKINGSTKTISGVDSVKVNNFMQVGNSTKLYQNFLILDPGSTYAYDHLYWASPSGMIQGYNYSRAQYFKPFRFDTSYVYIDSILTVSKSINTKSITADTLNLNNSKIYNGGGYLQVSAYTTIANKYIFNSDAFVSPNNTLDLGYPSATWRNLYLGTCLYSPTIKLTNTSEPSNPSAGTVYYNSSDNHYYGYNGTIWKQLDN